MIDKEFVEIYHNYMVYGCDKSKLSPQAQLIVSDGESGNGSVYAPELSDCCRYHSAVIFLFKTTIDYKTNKKFGREHYAKFYGNVNIKTITRGFVKIRQEFNRIGGIIKCKESDIPLDILGEIQGEILNGIEQGKNGCI